MKIKKWFLRNFVYRVYQKSHLTNEGMMVVKTYLSGTDKVHHAYLSEDEMNRVLNVYELERKDMERERYVCFGC
jgi:hypothetical protein